MTNLVVFARPPQTLCCGSSSDCVIWLRCASSGTSSYDVDGDGDFDYCLNSEWWDCNSDSNCAAREWCDTGTHDCKDDFRPLCSACNRNAQCIGNSCINGHCTTYASEAGLCNDGIDNDCGEGTDCADSDCPPCCGTENAVCCSPGDNCYSGLYCSKIDPKTGESHGDTPHCCDADPVYWWNPAIIGDEKCRNVESCNPECIANPFNDNCIISGNIYGCCDFMGTSTSRIITTY